MKKSRGFLVLASLWLLAGIPAGAQDAEQAKAVDKAVERGVNFLKTLQTAEGVWPRGDNFGTTALAGLTLLECGVPATDMAVQKAADAIRKACLRVKGTYELSTGILFLDRLGDPQDVPLIEALTVQLLAGQDRADRGWSYECPFLLPSEVDRLAKAIKNRKVAPAKEAAPKEAAAKKPRTLKDLPREIRAQIQTIYATPTPQTTIDHSNTQFAIMALWAARRHGLPVDTALQIAGMRFRRTQWDNGGWGYQYPGGVVTKDFLQSSDLYKPSASMTCTGLMGLAYAYGTVKTTKVNAKKMLGLDPNVKLGFLALGTFIGEPTGDVKKGAKLENPGHTYYFLWTLNRTALIYGLKTIGGKDWYQWGTEIILANQNADGSWTGQFPEGGPDTCFALLFLKRANVAKDLSSRLKGQGTDPGKAPPKLLEMIERDFGPSELKKRKKSAPKPDAPGKQSARGRRDGPVTSAASARLERRLPQCRAALGVLETRRRPALA